MLNAKVRKAFKGFKIAKVEEKPLMNTCTYVLEDTHGHTITINLNIPLVAPYMSVQELKYNHQFIEIKSFLESLGRW